MPIQEGRKHAYYDVSGRVACCVKNTNFEFQFLNIIILTIISEIYQVLVELRLKQKVLNNDNSLRSKNLVLHCFSSSHFILCTFKSWLQSKNHGEQERQSFPRTVYGSNKQIELFPGRIQCYFQCFLLNLGWFCFVLQSQSFNDVLIYMEVFPLLIASNVSFVRFLFLLLVYLGLKLCLILFLFFRLRVHEFKNLLLFVDYISVIYMQEVQYLPYKLGSLCQHGAVKTSTNYVDVACSRRTDVYHRVSQAGKTCNKCATLIMNCINSVQDCPCCSEKLQSLISQAWICTHRNRNVDQITIKCLSNQKQSHEVPFKQKVCKNCYDKIRAAFMFAPTCVVCSQKQNQLFENIEKTITKPSFYYFGQIIKEMSKNKYSQKETKEQIQHYCLAEPRNKIQSKFEAEAAELGQNLPEYHQSKRYQLYPKCSKHRNNHIDLCNNCLVAVLNLNCCPYGCSYEKKQAKAAKVDPPVVSQAGFLCMYPKETKQYQYLQYFSFRHVEQANRLDKWEGSLRKIKYSGSDKITNKFALYGSTVQISKSSFIFCGGLLGEKITNLKTCNNTFIVQISENQKNFTIQNVGEMNESRSSHGLVFYKEHVYSIGGFFKQGPKCLSSCEKFSLKSKKWQKIASMSVERSKPNTFEYKGKIYAMGGVSSNENIWNSLCQRYDTQKDKWQSIDYKGFGIPFINSATSLSRCWGIGELSNVLLIGGSNYEISTYLLQEVVFSENGFKMNPSTVEQRLQFNRQSAALSLMKSGNDKQKVILVFGGLEEHESFLNLDAVQLKIHNHEATPFFVYDNVSVGSYRLLLRENTEYTYEYMMNKLLEQGLLTKQKLGENKDNLLKKDATLHLIQRMWYGVGKNLIGFSGV